MDKGICLGVSVGPGDPSQITEEALSAIRASDVVFLPSAPKEECRAYIILKQAWPKIADCDVRCLEDEGKAGVNFDARHAHMIALTEELLDSGKNVAFPALGDVSLYSTYNYLHEQLTKDGYVSGMISGISSVQAVCARLGVMLASGREQVHVFPDAEDLEDRLDTPGTLVFMKPKKDRQAMMETIRRYVSGHPGREACGVSNCGTPDEVCAFSADELEKLAASYYTVVIVRGSCEDAPAGSVNAAPEADAYAPSHDYFENRACKYYPCHHMEHINCMFCYCPMYHIENCPGKHEYKISKRSGKRVKVCTDCTFPHEKDHYDTIMAVLRENR